MSFWIGAVQPGGRWIGAVAGSSAPAAGPPPLLALLGCG